MDDLYTKIQIFLMKKDREYGQLKFLSSRTTEDNIKHIEDVCCSITNIFQSYGIKVNDPNKKDDSGCIQSFKYLVVNTNFKVQEQLLEDIVNGHLVDMCLPLSPYLLMEVLWYLEYDDILAESILHVPVDLCVELLAIIRRCIELLEFERASKLIITLIRNVYKIFIRAKEIRLQMLNEVESLKELMLNVGELISMLSDSKFTKVEELKGLKKYERYGILLKKTLQVAKDCFQNTKESTPMESDKEKFYKLTFGRNFIVQCDLSRLDEYILEFHQALVNALLKIIKEIDCNTYLGWAELCDPKKSNLSLQQSIGYDCYYFIESVKDIEHLEQFQHLSECLKQLSSKPGPVITPTSMSLQDLCQGVNNKKPDCLKELINRYSEWDESTLSYVEKNLSLLDRNDCFNLLDILTYVLKHSDKESYKQQVYSVTMKGILLQNIPDVFQIVLEYILKYDASADLESQYTEKNFQHFIARNPNFKSPKNLRVILFFIVQNPKKIILNLLKITIGHPDYPNIMILPDDLLLLSTIMQIRINDKETLLVNALMEIWKECKSWNMKKFTDLIQTLVHRQLYTANDIINKIFIPYLESDQFTVTNLKSLLNCVRTMRNSYTRKLRAHTFLVAIVKKIFFLRKDIKLPKYQSSELICLLIRTIEDLFNDEATWLDQNKRFELIERLSDFPEPVDKLHLAPLWYMTRSGVDVTEIIQDYERRCFTVMNKVKEDQKLNENLCKFLKDFSFLRDDFLRHLILRCTEAEYMTLGSQATIIHWEYFNWIRENDAYNNFLRITMEACLLSLEYPKSISPETFSFLIKCSVKFTKWYSSINVMMDYEFVKESLIKNIKILEDSIKHSTFSDLYIQLMVWISNTSRNESAKECLQELIQALQNFGNQCLELNHESISYDNAPSTKARRFHIAQEFISLCMTVHAPEVYKCLSVMDRVLYPEHYSELTSK
ncbi:uncharacterized protein LOC107263965 [Cephus cinctus]|uniref:Uncharacterized protein LOC107263965 n=1 Tax=Cephus cinctus TaxID=211228 RepID=A0AAJ7BIW8_CEPCN|nr:uncharacterized protein LOC107263965 [Cephus cinctus]